MTVLDLFAGPGGWSTAMARLGLHERGIEWNEHACATARAAGHHRELADVREIQAGLGDYEGLIASPPCQTFSMAGGKDGRRSLDVLLDALRLVAAGSSPLDAIEEARHGIWLFGEPDELDERSALVLEPLRIIRDARPAWVALEQVPDVLPVWEAYARALRIMGYSTDVGILSAEMYGVPQTRRRAILVASRTKAVYLPRPTHSRYYAQTPELLDRGVQPWISMAQALGWAASDLVGFPRLPEAGDETLEIEGTDYRARDLRTAEDPALTLTEKARSWQRWAYRGAGLLGEGRPRDEDHPAATVTGNGGAAWELVQNDLSRATRRDPDEPAPTILGHDTHWEMVGTWRDERNAARRSLDEPASTIVGQGDSRWKVTTGNFGGPRGPNGERGPNYTRDVEAPSPTITGDVSTWRVNDQSGTERDEDWPTKRPATTVAGRDLVTDPGANTNRFNEATKSRNDGIRVSIPEAAILQGFPADYPWQGSKTAQYQQIGDAIPPPLAEAILWAVADELICPECGNDTVVAGERLCPECLEASDPTL